MEVPACAARLRVRPFPTSRSAAQATRTTVFGGHIRRPGRTSRIRGVPGRRRRSRSRESLGKGLGATSFEAPAELGHSVRGPRHWRYDQERRPCRYTDGPQGVVSAEHRAQQYGFVSPTARSAPAVASVVASCTGAIGGCADPVRRHGVRPTWIRCRRGLRASSRSSERWRNP